MFETPKFMHFHEAELLSMVFCLVDELGESKYRRLETIYGN